MKPIFFKEPADLRAWLEQNHDKALELLVGFYKKGSGKRGLSWSESVDEALCFGWIDGRQHPIDADSYALRFTPRKPKSTWSTVNINKVAALIEQGRMTPAGLAAFERREAARSGIYAFEQGEVAFDPASLSIFKANKKAWAYFSACPPWYRKNTTWWVVSAKQESTRQRRLQQLIADSEQGLYIKSQRRR